MDTAANTLPLCSKPLKPRPQKGKCKVTTPLDSPVSLSYIHPMFPTAHIRTPWTDRLALDVALLLEGSGATMQEVLDSHQIDANDLLTFKQDPLFLRKVDALRVEVREKGLTFKVKAKAMAEEMLETSWGLVHDPATSPAVKADLIKSMVKWAGYEPKNDVATEVGGGVRITINLGGQQHEAKVVEADVTEVQSEPSGQLIGAV